jgi:hypothetical protein
MRVQPFRCRRRASILPPKVSVSARALNACTPIALGALAALAACGGSGRGADDATPTTDAVGDAQIDATGAPLDAPPDACPFGAWTRGAEQPFANVNSSDTDWGVEVSRDGLRLVFASDRPDPQQVGESFDIYMAERSSTAVPFERPVHLPISTDGDDQDPTLSDDARELYYATNVDRGPCIYVSTRASTTAGWTTPRRLDALCASGDPAAPFLSRDGLRLYYDFAVGEGSTVMVATRDIRSLEFTTAGVPAGAPDLQFVALDDAELTIYGEHVVSGRAQLWQATRPNLAAPFSAFREIAELADAAPFESGDPSVTGDGAHLVYSSTRIGTGDGPNDIYVAERRCQ